MPLPCAELAVELVDELAHLAHDRRVQLLELRHRGAVERDAAVLARDHRRDTDRCAPAAPAPRGSSQATASSLSSSTKPLPSHFGQRPGARLVRIGALTRSWLPSPTGCSTGALAAGDARELRKALEERQLDRQPGGPVAVLGDVDLGDARVLGSRRL